MIDWSAIVAQAPAYVIAIVALLLVLASRKGVDLSLGNLLKIKTGSDKSRETDSIIHHLEVRYYRSVLESGVQLVKDDLRYRVRKNGWDKEEWHDYVDEAIKQIDIILTRHIDEHYYHDALVDRVDLYEWNRKLDPQVQDRMRSMFDRLVAIMEDAHRRADEKRNELQEIMDHRVCRPKDKRCPNVMDIIRLTTEILVDESLTAREQCMIEVERYLEDLRQSYYSHYLTMYKQSLEKKGKKAA